MPIKPLLLSQHKQFEQLGALVGTLFNSSEWLKIYDNKLEQFGIFDNDNKLIGAFHLYKVKQYGLTYYKNPPFTPHIGLFYENKANNTANALTFEKNLIAEITDFIESLPYSLLTLALPHFVINTQPFFWKKFKVIPNYTYHLDLTLTENQLFENLASDKRNSLKKFEKEGVQTKMSTDYELVKQLVIKTFSRKQKNLDTVLINKILFDFANPLNSFAFISYINNQPSATSFCVFDNKTCYYLLGGYDTENKHHGAGVSAIWNAVLHARKLGLKIFDFEGSMLPEVESFFRGFGGNLIPYYTINKAKLPIEMGLKLIKREVF